MDCNDIRQEMPAYLYGELTGRNRAELEEHLLACPACREQMDHGRSAMALLDAWPPMARQPEDQPAVVLAGQAGSMRPPYRPGRLRAVLMGAAAAVLVFVVLALASAEVEFTDGRFCLSFGAAATAKTSPQAPGNRPLPPLIHTVAAEVVDDRMDQLASALDEAFIRQDRMQEDRLLLLARTLEIRRSEDLQRFSLLLGECTRAAMEDTFTWVADDSSSRLDNLPPNGKEETR